MVPAEVQVAVGAVELGQVRQHAGVGDARPGGVGALERALHPPVEHRAVPRRQLVRGQEAQP